MLRMVVCALIALVLVAPATVRAESAPLSEAQFVALQEAALSGSGGTPQDGSRPLESAKPIEKPKAKDDEDPDNAGSGDEAAGSGDDDGEGTPAGEDDPDKDGSLEGDEDAEPALTPAERKAEDKLFREALRAQGVNASLEDIPESARPVVAKKLKDLEAGFTRAMQEVREDQRQATAFRAEERFRKEHTADFIVSMLMERPEISAEVNARIEEMEGNDTALRGHKAIVEEARRSAMGAETSERDAAEKSAKRQERIVRIGKAAAKAAGVPFEMGVEEAIAARLAMGEELTEPQIRDIARQKARVFQEGVRKARRAGSAEYVQGKVGDRKAGLQIKPNEGVVATPGKKGAPKNDEEFIETFLARSG